jgi:hypothetical protein
MYYSAGVVDVNSKFVGLAPVFPDRNELWYLYFRILNNTPGYEICYPDTKLFVIHRLLISVLFVLAGYWTFDEKIWQFAGVHKLHGIQPTPSEDVVRPGTDFINLRFGRKLFGRVFSSKTFDSICIKTRDIKLLFWTIVLDLKLPKHHKSHTLKLNLHEFMLCL